MQDQMTPIAFDARVTGVCSQRALGEAPKSVKQSTHGAGAATE
jgi:hypothetical protein